MREPREHAALLAQVFGALEVPFALERTIVAGHTALGRGVVALLRCALAAGSADDLLAWLRTPGKLARPGLADRLEQRARVEGAATATAARRLWEADHPDFVLHELDRLAEAAGDPAALCRRLAAECSALFAAPHRGRARVLAGPEALDARVAGALRSALGELERLAAVDRALVPAPGELARVLHDLEVRAHDDPRPGLVAITSPRALRARRVRAAFLCGLREDAFPRPATPEPFLGDDERRALNAASGLRLRLREDRLDAERYLLYAVVSRPTELLALSWPAADDEGEPCVRSLFVDDVLDCFAAAAAERVQRRPLGAAGFEAALAPTENEDARARLAAGPGAPEPALASLRDARVLGFVNARATWSASALEAYASCPVKWFVDRLLRPDRARARPRADAARRSRPPRPGGHAARAVGRWPADARAPRRGPRAPAHAASTRAPTMPRISPNAERRRAALRRLEADLLRYVEQAAHGQLGLRAEGVRAALRRPGRRSGARRAGRRRAAPAGPHRPHRRQRGRRRGDRLRLQGQGRAAPGQMARGRAPAGRALPAGAAAAARRGGGRRPLPAARPRRRRAPARPAARRRRSGPGQRRQGSPGARGVRRAPAGGPGRRAAGAARDPLGCAGPRPDVVRLRAAAARIPRSAAARRRRSDPSLHPRAGAGHRASRGRPHAVGQRGLGEDVGAGRALRRLRRARRPARRPGAGHHLHREGGRRAARPRARAPARARRARGRARGRRGVDHHLPRLLRADPARARGGGRPRPRLLRARSGRRPRRPARGLRRRAGRLPRRAARRRARPRRRLHRRSPAAHGRRRARRAALARADAPGAADAAPRRSRRARAPRCSARTPRSPPSSRGPTGARPSTPRARRSRSAASRSTPARAPIRRARRSRATRAR